MHKVMGVKIESFFDPYHSSSILSFFHSFFPVIRSYMIDANLGIVALAVRKSSFYFHRSYGSIG